MKSTGRGGATSARQPHEWITITGHEGIPDYNAISDPHCPVARTPAVLKLCELHAAPIPQLKKRNPEATGGGCGGTHSHGHMCSRQKRALDFLSKQKRMHATAGGSHGVGTHQRDRRPKRMIKRWNLSTVDEQSDDDDDGEDEDAYIIGEGDRGGGKGKSASPPRNREIENVLENWSSIRDDISGCWAFYGINAVYLDRKREEETKLFEGVQRLYDREDDARQAEVTARDRVLKRERLAQSARERQGSVSGVDPLLASTANSRLRANEKPLSPRGRQQSSVVEPKAPPTHAQKGNPRHSASGGSGMLGYVAPFGSLQQQSSSQPPIPKPPPRRPFQQPQSDAVVSTTADPAPPPSPPVEQPAEPNTPTEATTSEPPRGTDEELIREPSIHAPSEMILETEATPATSDPPPHAAPPNPNPISNGNSFRGGDVVPLDENSPVRPTDSHHQFENVQTQHINDLIMDDDVSSPSRPAVAGYEEDEEL